MTAMTIFIGPTAATDVRQDLSANCNIQPPVSRGGIATLIAQHQTPGVIVVVDGYVEHKLSVSHAELCTALDAGWAVWGLCDMGAIRAYELRHEGMQGYGQVYHALNSEPDLSDSEILWDFEATAPYRPRNEPLLHLRRVTAHFVATHRLNTQSADRINEALNRTWYKDRTLALFHRLLTRHAKDWAPSMQTLAALLQPFRMKQLDLQAFFHDKPWRDQTEKLKLTATDTCAMS